MKKSMRVKSRVGENLPPLNDHIHSHKKNSPSLLISLRSFNKLLKQLKLLQSAYHSYKWNDSKELSSTKLGNAIYQVEKELMKFKQTNHS